MEILTLVLLYYLSQDPKFSESVKPLMEKLKNSEQMLCFLKDLSNFSQTFSAFKSDPQPPKQGSPDEKKQSSQPPKNDNKEKSQSPTEGIADEFIQNILNTYLSKN